MLGARRRATQTMMMQLRQHPNWFPPASVGAWETFARVYPFVFAAFAFVLSAVCFAVVVTSV
jgi:hypothetical protein